MKDFVVYECGGMGKFGKDNFDKGNAWRRYCKQALETCECDYRVRVVNFVDEPPQYKSQAEVMNHDLHKLRKSDLVIANFNDMYSLGSMAELAIAHERRIPVIGLDIDRQTLHPWQVCMCERIFTDIDEMLEYIKDFYLR